MARIRRWKEKLLIAWFMLFASVVWGRARSSTPEGRSGAARSLVVTGNGGKRSWGVTFSVGRPYVRAFSASLVPVALPVAVGAFTASASAASDPAGAAANASASCASVCSSPKAAPCAITTAICCNPCQTVSGKCKTTKPIGGSCTTLHTVITANGGTCISCGFGTCPITHVE